MNAARRTIAIASGKGGVGKTFITANLGIALALRLGPSGEVVGVDLDVGAGNLSSCLGVRAPALTINDFIMQRTNSLASTLTPTDAQNLKVISGSFDGLLDTHLADGWKDRLIEGMKNIHSNFMLMDLAAGTSSDVLDFFLGAGERIVVVVPETLSMQNAFLFIKSAIIRLIDQELGRAAHLAPVRDKVREITGGQENIELKSLIERIKEWDLFAGYMVRGIIDDLRIKVVINMYRGGKQKRYLERFHNLLLRHLYLRNFEYLGVIHFGKRVHEAVQHIKPFILAHPNDAVTRDIKEMAVRLAKEIEDPEPRLRLPQSPWIASLKRVRRATM